MAMQKQGEGLCCLVWTETTRDTALGSSVFTADSGVQLDSLAQGVPQTRAQTPQAAGDKVFPRTASEPHWTRGEGRPVRPLLLLAPPWGIWKVESPLHRSVTSGGLWPLSHARELGVGPSCRQDSSPSS